MVDEPKRAPRGRRSGESTCAIADYLPQNSFEGNAAHDTGDEPSSWKTVTFSVCGPTERPYLLLEAGGPAHLGHLMAIADLACSLRRTTRCSRLVLDFTGIDQSLTPTEHLTFGSYVGRMLASYEAVAAVVRPETRTGLSEQSARRTGLHLYTFCDLKQAIAWIATSE